MAVVHRASATANNASTTSFTINKPAGTAAGDVLVAFIGSTATGPTAPAGWTLQVDSFAGHFVYSKVAGASEPASYTWTAGSAQRWDGGISAFTGVSNANPWDVIPVFSTFTATAASVTTTSANAMLTGGAENGAAGNIVPPAGSTEWWESGGTTHAEMAGAIQAAAGASGSKTWTVGTPNAAWLGALQDANATQTVTSPTFVDTSAQVFAPAVIGNTAIVAGFVPSSAAVFAPTVSVTAGPQTVTPSFVGSTAQVFAPSLTQTGTLARVKATHQSAISVVVDHEPL